MDTNNTQWQRLSPWAVVYFTLVFAYRFVAQGLLNMLPVLFVFIVKVEDKWFWGPIALAVGAVVLVAYAALYYVNFRYYFEPGQRVQLHKGVFKKERLSLRFERIQNVNISTPFYFSPFGRTNCQIDAAGSAAKEIVLPALTLKEAEDIRTNVLMTKAHMQNDTPNEEEPSDDQPLDSQALGEPALALSNKEVAKFGLFSNMAIIAFAALMPAVNMLDDFIETFLIDNIEAWVSQQAIFSAYVALISVIAVVALGLIVVIGASVIVALLRFYNFELYIEDARFRRVAGLLERHQLSVRYQKVQSVSIRQNAIALLLKRCSVRFAQIAGNNVAEHTKNASQALLLPVLKRQQANAMVQVMFNWFDINQLALKPVSFRYFTHRALFYCVLPSVLLSALLWGLSQQWEALYGLLFALPLMLLFYGRYRRYGWQSVSVDNRHYLVHRKGVIGSAYTVCEVFKGQQVHLVQTPLMAKAGLASVSIVLASGVVSLPFIPEKDAQTLVDTLVYRIETDSRAWF